MKAIIGMLVLVMAMATTALYGAEAPPEDELEGLEEEPLDLDTWRWWARPGLSSRNCKSGWCGRR